MVNIFNQVWDLTFGLVWQFISTLWEGTDTIFSIGFGSIEWISMSLSDWYYFVTSLLLGILFLVLIFKIFKFFAKLTRRMFGGL